MNTPIDDLVKQWKSNVMTIGHNLMEFTDVESTKLVSDMSDDPSKGYIESTKAEAKGYLKELNALWSNYSLLSDVVDKAVALASRSRILNNPEKEIRSLLEGESIILTGSNTPIKDHGLLLVGNSTVSITPSKLQELMQSSFFTVRDGIERIAEATLNMQSKLSAQKSCITELTSLAKRFGVSSSNVFDFSLVEQLERDPLRGMLELTKLEKMVSQYRSVVESARQEYQSVEDSMNKIEVMISELYVLSAKSKESAEKTRNLFSEIISVKPVISVGVIDSLQSWLQTLQGKLTGGDRKAIKIGLMKLEQECTAKLTLERNNYAINNALYGEWNDLKGQFKALCAKADIFRQRGVFTDGRYLEILERTQTALYTIPIDLDVCRDLVRKIDSLFR